MKRINISIVGLF